MLNYFMSRKLWTLEENEIIINAKMAGMTYNEIVELLPHRTLRSISVQGAKICPGIKPSGRWSDDDEAKLIDLREARTPFAKCAEILGRTIPAVKTKAQYLVAEGLIQRQTALELQAEEDIDTMQLTPEEWEWVNAAPARPVKY